MSRIEQTGNEYRLAGILLDELLPLPKEKLGLLSKFGLHTADSFILRICENESRRLLAENLGVTQEELESWRDLLLGKFPLLAGITPCELGPVSFGMTFEAAPERLGASGGEFIKRFRNHLGNCILRKERMPDVDLRPEMHDVVAQPRGFCWAYSVVAAAESLLIGSSFKGSEAFVVQVGKNDTRDRWPGQDGGSPYVAAQVIREYGLPSADTYPMSPDLVIEKLPPEKVFTEAKKNSFGGYFDIEDEFGSRVAAAYAVLSGDSAEGIAGRALVLALPIYGSFRAVGKDGIVPDPFPNESVIGYHAMTVVGAINLRVGDHCFPYLIVRNSWGKEWGDNGYCYISQSYFENDANLLFNLFTVNEFASSRFATYRNLKEAAAKAASLVPSTVVFFAKLAAALLLATAVMIAINMLKHENASPNVPERDVHVLASGGDADAQPIHLEPVLGEENGQDSEGSPPRSQGTFSEQIERIMIIIQELLDAK